MTSTEAPVVSVDRFPVQVVFDDRHLFEARVILTQPDTEGVGTLYVWTAPDRLVLQTSYQLHESDIRSKGVDWSITTDVGVVVVKPSPGCGCGNRLKYFTPFTPMRMGRLRR